MTITLPYDSTDVTTVFLFPKDTLVDDDLYDFKVYKNKELLYNFQLHNESDNTRHLRFELTTNDVGDIPITKEGWYDWTLTWNNDGTIILVDEGQLFIGDYKESETEKVFYEK